MQKPNLNDVRTASYIAAMAAELVTLTVSAASREDVDPEIDREWIEAKISDIRFILGRFEARLMS